LDDAQSEEVFLEIDGKKVSIPIGAYMIILATDNETGKHHLLNFLWPCHNIPRFDHVCFSAKSVAFGELHEEKIGPSWSVTVKEYKIPRLYLYQQAMKEWGKLGAVIQSGDMNKFRSKTHPNQNDFPPVICNTAEIN
jgi:hypothetical protein